LRFIQITRSKQITLKYTHTISEEYLLYKPNLRKWSSKKTKTSKHFHFEALPIE